MTCNVDKHMMYNVDKDMTYNVDQYVTKLDNWMTTIVGKTEERLDAISFKNLVLCHNIQNNFLVHI